MPDVAPQRGAPAGWRELLDLLGLQKRAQGHCYLVLKIMNRKAAT